MSVQSDLLTNTQNTFQNTAAKAGCPASMVGGKKRKMKKKRSMKKKRRSMKKRSSMKKRNRRRRRKQRGGGYGVTFESLNKDAHNGLGHSSGSSVAYSNCDKDLNQTGGGNHSYSTFNHAGTPSYGYDAQGAQLTTELRGSYPAYTQSSHSQCGGKKKKGKKGKKSKRKTANKKNKGKKGKKCMTLILARPFFGGKRKSRKGKKIRQRRQRRRTQRGGNKYSSPGSDLGSKPWATAPLSINKEMAASYDNYNHYTRTYSA